MSADSIATVQDLISFLEKSFKEDDLLCFFDEGGAWCELVHVPKTFIGNPRWMFSYVKGKRQHELDSLSCYKDDVEHMKEVIEGSYKLVEDDGVVVL